jgi:MerR family transcriptional regulator, thiopeptide resistance regulator
MIPKGAMTLKAAVEKLYQPHEFARRAGVTVRTLHHYDRLGLLKPSRYTQAGYRLYSDQDLGRLQQVVTLKFIGLSLKQIKEILRRKSFDLATALRVQRQVIVEKRRQLDAAIRAIEKAEKVMASDQEPNWETFKKIIEVINMQSNMEWTKKYYSEEAQEEIAKRAATIPREVIEQGQRDWAALIKDVESAVAAGEDPASERAQSLAERWTTLVRGFTGGNSAIQAGLNKMYADKGNWPASFPKPYSEEVQAFIRQVMAANSKTCASPD